LSSEGKIVEVRCPKCKNILRIKVDATMLASAVSPPISITHVHADPKYPAHSTTIWVDKNYDIRAVEASDSTILGQGMDAGRAQHSGTSEGKQLESLFPDEVEIADKAMSELKRFLEGTGRLSAEIARGFTDAYDQFYRLSEILQRKMATAKPVTLKGISSEKSPTVGKVAKPTRNKEGERRSGT
jgi:hypothetical protein